MLKNCFISFISPGIYQCNRTSNRKKRTKFNLNVLHSILLYFMRRVHLYCTTLYIYCSKFRDKMQMQILWKFLLSNLAIINPETCSNLSRYCFALKICIVFFKILRIKILFKLFKKLLLRK